MKFLLESFVSQHECRGYVANGSRETVVTKDKTLADQIRRPNWDPDDREIPTHIAMAFETKS